MGEYVMGKFISLGQLYAPTRKLFHKNAYLTEIETCVLGVRENFIILQDTIFYAESGGQDADRGFIEDIAVVDVQDQQGRLFFGKNTYVDVPAVSVDTVVVHFSDTEPPFKAGDAVRLKLDWERRYKLMRNHSAAHFLFHATGSVVAKRYGDVPTITGCHISTDGVRFDFSADIPADLISEIETVTNELIQQGDEIVRRPEPLSDEIYYWIYKDIVIPCGGTHVLSARELGPVSVRRKKQGKGKTRIGFEGVSGETGTDRRSPQ